MTTRMTNWFPDSDIVPRYTNTPNKTAMGMASNAGASKTENPETLDIKVRLGSWVLVIRQSLSVVCICLVLILSWLHVRRMLVV